MKEELLLAKNYTWIKGVALVGPQGHDRGVEEGQSLEGRRRGHRRRKGKG